MENQTIIFTNSLYNTPPVPFYAPYHTPPYTLNYSVWPEAVYQPFSMNEDVLQMQQQLRFPTPPITPPRGCNNTLAELTPAQPKQELAELKHKTQQQRTQSVIMKVGHDQNPQHLPADLPYDTLVENNKYTHHGLHEHGHHNLQHHDQQQHQLHVDTPSSGTSSPTSHNEFICDWIDCGR